MAFPFIFSDGFETGAHGMTATSGTLIDYPHFTELARQGMTPYRGAYCLRVRLAGGTTSQFAREDTAFDDLDANGAARWLAFSFYLGKDMVFGATDRFSLVEIESTLNTTTEVAAGIVISSGNVQFWWAEAGGTALTTNVYTLGTTTTALGKWYHAELAIVYDNAGNNNGTIDAFINGVSVGTQVTGLDQADAVDVKFGVIGPDAGTSGTVLLDDIIYDDTGRIYMPIKRYRDTNIFVHHAADHPLIGPGSFSCKLTGTSTDAVLQLYDSDGVPDNLSPIDIIRNVSANEDVPSYDVYEVRKGVYSVLSGTGAQAFFSIENGGIVSDGQMISYGRAQKIPRK